VNDYSQKLSVFDFFEREYPDLPYPGKGGIKIYEGKMEDLIPRVSPRSGSSGLPKTNIIGMGVKLS
jgi:hypothetical protein